MALTNRLGAPQLVLGGQLIDWTKALGEPSVVVQKDLGNTFFYWPAHGVAVFCHPLYHKQYQYKKREDWVVTSIVVPLTNKIHPQLPPVDPDARIVFTNLLFTPSEAAKARWDALPKVSVHLQDGVTVALEIKKPDSFLGDYD